MFLKLTGLAFLMATAGASAAEPQAEPPTTAEPITFCVALSDADESHAVTSTGKGLGILTLNRADLTLRWEIAYRGLSGPAVEANIHGPQRPGANAAALFPLSGGAAPQNPLTGTIVLTDGQLKYLLNSRMYANVTTRKYPLGEIRGQIQRVRPGVACPTL